MNPADSLVWTPGIQAPDHCGLEPEAVDAVQGAPSRNVAALVYDGIPTFEFGVASEIFGLNRGDADWYDFTVCTLDPPPVRSRTGLSIDARLGLDELEGAGTILLFGWKEDVPVPDAVIRSLCNAYARGARIVSICEGAFVLARTGLLDGRRVTTHWRHAHSLARLHPAIQVDGSVIYVDEGQILTSAGGAAAIDLLVHLVRRDFGLARATILAQCLIMPPHRDGGQAQIVDKPIPVDRGGRLASLLVRMRASLRLDFTIAQLASEAAMSERTFLRRFREMTGMPPSRWLTLARIEAAREMLEDGHLPIAEVAYRSGFGSVETLRHHFRRELRLSPRDYRQRFGQMSRSLSGAPKDRRQPN